MPKLRNSGRSRAPTSPCPTCTGTTSKGEPCRAKAACRLDPTATRCRLHQTAKSGVAWSVLSPIIAFGMLVSQGLARVDQNEKVLQTMCKKPKPIYQSREYKTVRKKYKTISAYFDQLNQNVEANLGKFDMATMNDAVELFEEAEMNLFRVVKKHCPEAASTFLLPLPGVEIDESFTCSGTPMPKDLREWVKRENDGQSGKRVFCLMPSTVTDFFAGYAKQMAGIDGLPITSATMLHKGMKLENNFSVAIVSGPYIGVSQKA